MSNRSVLLNEEVPWVDPGPSKQHEASDPARSVWVAASAGSGKTKVLTDRLLRLLLADVPPPRILGLTFTKAAAAEMSVRLTERLGFWAACDDESLSDDLGRLQNKPPTHAQITLARRLLARVLEGPGGVRLHTIHAFAQEILRRFPVEANLPPHFTVLEGAEADALWQETLRATLHSAAKDPDSREGRALGLLATRLNEEKLSDLLRVVVKDRSRLADFPDNDFFPRVQARIRGLLRGLTPTTTEEGLVRELLAEGAAPWARVQDALREWARATTSDDLRMTYTTAADRIAQGTDAWGRADVEAYTGVFLTKEGAPRARVGAAALRTAHPDLQDVLEGERERLAAWQVRRMDLQTAETTEALLTLGEALRVAYAERKAARAGLDFDDLIARAGALLARPDRAPWVLFKLDGGLDHLLVDEAQDTNPEHWRIIQALTEEFFAGEGSRGPRSSRRTLFVVGDEKQSIFSFQGADPDVFENVRSFFRTHLEALGADRYAEVPLNVSYRSAPAILRAVDAVFATDEARRGVSHAPVHHEAFRREALGHVEVWPLVESAEDSGEDDEGTDQAGMSEDDLSPLPLSGYEAEEKPAAILAARLADSLAGWLRGGIRITDRVTGALRNLRPEDVMILVRKRAPMADLLVSALKTRGVPVVGVDRMILTEQLAVKDLLALLRFMLLPDDDLTLATVLRGPLIGASEDQLMHLAVGRTGSLWQSLSAAAVREGEASAMEAMRAYLAACLGRADQDSPFGILTRILMQPCPADPEGSGRRALATRLGPEMQDPVDETLAFAQTFGQRITTSLQAFVQALTSGANEIKREMDPGLGQVRITTVHASKGLEAPFVILPDASQEPNPQKLPRWLWHRDPVRGDEIPFYAPNDAAGGLVADLRNTARERQVEEDRRLLYVAMTRATDRLLVAGWAKRKKTSEVLPPLSWYARVREALTPLSDPCPPSSGEEGVTPVAILADVVLFPRPPKAMVEEETSSRRRPGPREAGQSVDDFLGTPAFAGVTRPEGEGREVSAPPPLPPWARTPPPPEPERPRLVRPSESEGDTTGLPDPEPPFLSPRDRRLARGLAVHRLLQMLPEIPEARWEDAAQRSLADARYGLAPEEREATAREVLAILRNPAFAPLFGPDSLAEAPIIGRVGEDHVAGQVDRLVLPNADEVWVVDYKTNRVPPRAEADVPRLYRRQMDLYAALLRDLYPTRRVRSFLLWTCGPWLMEVPSGVP